MPAFVVRHVVSGEHDALRNLRLRSLREDPGAFGATLERDAAKPARWWTDWAAASEDGEAQRTFVLVDDDGVWQGLALVRRLDGTPHLTAETAELNAMWIAPAARGVGGALRLADACAHWAAARGVARLRLVVRTDNARAIAAYQRAGFTRDATDERDDSLVMSRLVA